MKKKIDEILDGVTAEELQELENNLPDNAEAGDADADRIARLVAEKTGLDVADKTEDELSAKKKAKILHLSGRKLIIPAVAVICLVSLLIGTFVFVKTGKEEFNDGVIGENKEQVNILKKIIYGEDEDICYEAVEKADGAEYSAEAVEEAEGYSSYSKGCLVPDDAAGDAENSVQAHASLLTAKEYRDLDYVSDWLAKLGESEWENTIGARKIYAGNIVTVNVKDGSDPVYNAKVELTENGKAVFTAVTDVNGCAYLFYDLKNTKQSREMKVRIGETVYDIPSDGVLNVEAKKTVKDINYIDVMFMIDTTGSMGDELTYLQEELKDVVSRVGKAKTNAVIRVSVNFYRDEGDAYVVKYYDFRTDIDQCLEQIKAESAMGGGDYAEAVHTALDNAVNGHNWREEAVKLCFFVLDAPAHSEEDSQGVNDSLRSSLVKAAELGIRIIPVVASGADTDTESLMRTAAVLTNGTYVYLTDESGIGYSHKETEIDKEKENQTEYLNDCLVRLICEFSGISYTQQ